MLKRKEFILGAVAGLTVAAVATAGGVINWPGAHAEAAPAGRLAPSAGAPGLAFAPPQGAPLSFADIFQQVAPAVVQIDVKTRVQRPRGGVFQLPGFPPIPYNTPQSPESGEDEGSTSLGAGSGFFISADGFIVTNNHVIANAQEITVKLSDGRELRAELVGRDDNTDLAVIKVQGSGFPFVQFEEGAEPRVGDWVIAVGNPFGLGGTATAGIVSARARDLRDRSSQFVDYLQIDAAINRGNSGGPTFDIYGRVIGVNTAIFSPTGGSVGIGFAIPASTAKSVTDQLIRSGSVERGYLGVIIETLEADAAAALGLPAGTRGVYITEVNPDSPALRGGMQIGDVVTSVNGQAVHTTQALTRAVSESGVNEALRVEILRDGRRQTLNIRTGRRPADDAAATGGETPDDEATKPQAEPAGVVVEGMTTTPLTAALRDRFSIPANVEGVVVTAVAPRSRAAELGMPPGVVILRANNRVVTTPAELQAAVAAARSAGRETVLLLVRVGGGNRAIPLPLAAD